MEEKKDVLILGIESSCDETAASVVKNGRTVLSNVISSQIELHKLIWMRSRSPMDLDWWGLCLSE